MNHAISARISNNLSSCSQFIQIVLLIVIGFSKSISAQENRIGFVLKMDGVWLANGQPTQEGRGVAAGATIALSPGVNFRTGDKWDITIILLNNESISRACNSFQSCKNIQPFELPHSLTKPSSWRTRIYQAVSYLLSLNSERYIPTISREAGGPPQRLLDQVLLLDKGQISIGDWFKDIEKGSYRLTFVYIGREDESRNPDELTFNWHTNPTIPAKDLKPGLYVVRVFPASGAGSEPVSQDAWILLASAEQLEKHSSAYRDNVELTRHWKNVDPVAVQTFLRACLDQLDAPVKTSGTVK